MKLEDLKEKAKENSMIKAIAGIIEDRKLKKETKKKQIKVVQAALDDVVYSVDHQLEVPMTKEQIEMAREAAKLMSDAERAKQEKYECWTRIGTTIVKTVVYVGLGILTFELNKQMTLLVFNEQFSKGAPIDGRSLTNLMKANDNLNKNIMNNLNRKDGLL